MRGRPFIDLKIYYPSVKLWVFRFFFFFSVQYSPLLFFIIFIISSLLFFFFLYSLLFTLGSSHKNWEDSDRKAILANALGTAEFYYSLMFLFFFCFVFYFICSVLFLGTPIMHLLDLY